MAPSQVRVESTGPFLAWPGWAHLRYAGLLSLANTLWFLLVYGGADALTARRAFRVPVHLPAELHIPFVPWMAVAYMSIYPLFFLAPFILRARHEFRAAVGAMAFVILCGGAGFLLFPAELAFPPPTTGQLGAWAGLYRAADALNLTYNLLPSLHVAFAVVCAALFSPRAPGPVRLLLWSWAALIAASTVLIHQHHLLDVAAGWLLAVAGVKAGAALDGRLPRRDLQVQGYR
ncbi:MAG TPA: phosphatase PAP2 family protein [Thermoanaerobaculia bacterium]